MHYANLGINIDKITIVGAAEQLFFTGFLFVRRNQLVPVRNFQFTSVLVVSVAQRINVPFVVGAVCLLNVGTNNIRFDAHISLAITCGLPAEFFPMFEPRTA